MRIAIDASVVSRRLKGAGRVVKNLLLTLPVVDDSDYVALAWPEGAAMLRQAGVENVVETPESGGLAWELRGLGRAAEREGADVVLTLREIVGFGGPPTVLHVAEPPAYRLRSGSGNRPAKHVAKDRILQAMLRGSVRRAARVTAASRTTAEWLRERYGVESPVIPPGIDPVFLEQVEPPPTGEPYFLHPATGDRRDNSDLVLRAFALLRPTDVRLVLIGTPDDERARLAERARAVGVVEHVDFAGWVSDERLRDLYRGAIALVHPSRYEGFAGLQPLEAMAQGTPVVALVAPGTTEALAGAAELVRTEHPEELADAMRRLATDDVHQARLGETGRERVRDLTWERAAARFVEVFKEPRMRPRHGPAGSGGFDEDR
jgi:glycosyltransferase involved in cell wall biosynthesis